MQFSGPTSCFRHNPPYPSPWLLHTRPHSNHRPNPKGDRRREVINTRQVHVVNMLLRTQAVIIIIISGNQRKGEMHTTLATRSSAATCSLAHGKRSAYIHTKKNNENNDIVGHVNSICRSVFVAN